MFKKLSGWSLIEEMTRPEAESRMDKTEVGQPALFALQLGILCMVEAAGVRPAAVIGHSVGEVAAAFAAGAEPEQSGQSHLRAQPRRRRLRA